MRMMYGVECRRGSCNVSARTGIYYTMWLVRPIIIYSYYYR